MRDSKNNSRNDRRTGNCTFVPVVNYLPFHSFIDIYIPFKRELHTIRVEQSQELVVTSYLRCWCHVWLRRVSTILVAHVHGDTYNKHRTNPPRKPVELKT